MKITKYSNGYEFVVDWVTKAPSISAGELGTLIASAYVFFEGLDIERALQRADILVELRNRVELKRFTKRLYSEFLS